MLRRLLAALRGRKWWWDPLWDFLAVKDDGALGFRWGDDPESVAAACEARGWESLQEAEAVQRYRVQLEDAAWFFVTLGLLPGELASALVTQPGVDWSGILKFFQEKLGPGEVVVPHPALDGPGVRWQTGDTVVVYGEDEATSGVVVLEAVSRSSSPGPVQPEGPSKDNRGPDADRDAHSGEAWRER